MSESIKKTFRIALDAMGGDFAPVNEVLGAIEAFKNLPSDVNLEIILVGDENEIKKVISKHDSSLLQYSIVNATDVIKMHDEPSTAHRRTQSSMYIAADLHSKNKADAFVSAGNTGAMLSLSTILLGRIKGVSRPTIGSFFPTQNPRPTLVLDVGANVDVKARYLYEFAVMGDIYLERMLGLESPKVGLLNVGEEENKGTEVLQQTHALLKASDLNFIGNVEGGDILGGNCDVVICDGFTGNVVLKLAESVYHLIKSKLKKYSESGFLNKLILLIASPMLKSMFKDFDYQGYGGVPILGVNGVVIVGHGKSSPLAVRNMIYRAIEQIKKDINSHIELKLNESSNPQN